ncbi:MAG: YlxR family protein [Roseiflexaceae bacterium]|nr:YlxR family protein [Roseiflexaceae bacterium]
MATKLPRQKHIPQRTCIVCRTTGAKRGLMRLVRDGEGRVSYDATGKRAGRGAYLCHLPQCWEQALKRGALVRALRIEGLQAEDTEALREIAQRIVVEATGMAAS